MVKYLTTAEYAERFKKHPQHVRKMCEEGEIDAVKVGKTWRIPYVEPVDVQAEERLNAALSKATAPLIDMIDRQIEALEQAKEALCREKEVS